MKQNIIATCLVGLFACSNAQTSHNNLFNHFYTQHLKTKVPKKGTQLFAEINPQFFAFDGFGAGTGIEYARFQTGFIYLTTKLTPTYRDAIFKNAQDATVPNNTALEVFTNVFLRKDRKGFYVGSILSYDWYKVIDNSTQQSETFSKLYVVARAGFRWFPFQEYVYLDGGYGVSFNLNNPENRPLGNSLYSPKPLVTLPFFAVGCRVLLRNKTK